MSYNEDEAVSTIKSVEGVTQSLIDGLREQGLNEEALDKAEGCFNSCFKHLYEAIAFKALESN